MSKRSLSITLCVLILSSLVTNQAAADDRLGIAVVGPMSGPLSDYAKQMSDGARQAVEDINRKGGVNGKQLELFFYDDNCNPALAAEKARSAAIVDRVAM